MYISDIALENFRNYSKEKTSFSPDINILVGNNAQGKTNLIEAVFYLARGSSFKVIKDSDIIKYGEKKAVLDAQIIKGNRRKIIHIEINDKKTIKINGLQVSNLKEMKAHFDIVVFFPDHLKIIKEGPALRRAMIDDGIITLKPSYKKLLEDYQKLLVERNNLLKRYHNIKYFNEQISSITKLMATQASMIIKNRKKYIEELSVISYKKHLGLSDNKEEMKITYQNSINEYIDNTIHLSDKIYDKMMVQLKKDIEKGYTTIGPHRDDIDIIINEKSTRLFASQGQQRSAILSIKLAEIELIKKYNGDSPIILLDDVFSELDSKRREYLLENIKGIQALITTNTIKYFEEIKIYEIKEGSIKCI